MIGSRRLPKNREFCNCEGNPQALTVGRALDQSWNRACGPSSTCPTSHLHVLACWRPTVLKLEIDSSGLWTLGSSSDCTAIGIPVLKTKTNQIHFRQTSHSSITHQLSSKSAQSQLKAANYLKRLGPRSQLKEVNPQRKQKRKKREKRQEKTEKGKSQIFVVMPISVDPSLNQVRKSSRFVVSDYIMLPR